MPETQASPSRVGARLRQAREAAGLDLRAVCAQTKVGEAYLTALENSDYEALPARIYAVGFARTYATKVGLDGNAVAAEFRRELDEYADPVQPRPSYEYQLEDPAKIPSSRIVWIAAALLLALAVVGVIFWRGGLSPASDLPPVAAVETPGNAGMTAAAPTAPIESAPMPVAATTAAETALLPETTLVPGSTGRGGFAVPAPPAPRATTPPRPAPRATTAPRPRPSARSAPRPSARATPTQAPLTPPIMQSTPVIQALPGAAPAPAN